MVTLVGGANSIQALQDGAYQSATIGIYDATTSGHPSVASFTNEQIVQGSLSVNKTCLGSDTLTLGGGIADEMRVTIQTDSTISSALVGQIISLQIEWTYNTNQTETIYPFRGVVTEITRLRKGVYQITACDGFIVFDKPFKSAELGSYSNPSLPMEWPINPMLLLAIIVRDIGSPYIDANTILQETNPTNTSYAVYAIPEDQGYTYRQVLIWLAQLLGVNLRIKTMRIKTSGANQVLSVYQWKYVDNNLASSVRVGGGNAYDIAVGEVDNRPNTGVKIISGESVLYESTSVDRIITIADNAILTAMERAWRSSDWTTIAGNIAAKVNDALNMPSLIYDPLSSASVNAVSMWYLEPGDIIDVYDEYSNIYRPCPITSLTHTLNGRTQFSAGFGSDNPMNSGYSIPSFSSDQTNKLESIVQQFAYQPGDTYVDSYARCYGIVTSDSVAVRRRMLLTIPLPKFPTSSYTINSLVLYVRTVAGTYAPSTGFNALSNISNSYTSGSNLCLTLDKSDEWGATNNTPVAGQVGINITFN